MLNDLHTDPTQLTGLLAFALSAFACWHAAKLRGSTWRALAVAQLACFAEVLVGLRLRVHDLADFLLQGNGWYGARQSAQIPLLVISVLLSIAWAVVVVIRWRRNVDVCIAVLATSAVVALFVIELISLHGVDAIMYVTIGPVLLIGVAWAAGALVVAASALHAAKAGSSPARQRQPTPR